MCGVAGIVSLTGKPVTDAETRLRRMNSRLEHRGPDQRGVWVSDDGLVGLANTRLSIVGVDEAPELPLRMPSQSHVLAFNGEIYNYSDLRREMQTRGDKFRTHTDTEVLLHGLAHHGEAFLDRLDGVWGFAFYDVTDRSLKLSRDLMGEKSLYYAVVAGELVFASEVPAILEAVLERPEWDMQSIACSFQYRATLRGHTLLREVKKLPAGHMLTCQPGQAEILVSQQQTLHLDPWLDFFASDPDLRRVSDKLEELLHLACSRRLPAEVDYMATLSGGLDSTLVNFFLSDRGKRPIESLYGHSTRTPPQKGGDLDEYGASLFTAKKLGVRHREFLMYTEENISLYQQDAADCFDGIFCEAVTNFRQLAAEARRLGKRVLVTSDGPDELLGGYDVDVRSFRVNERLSALPSQSQSELARRALDTGRMEKTGSSLLNWAYLRSDPFAVRPNHGGTHPRVMAALFREKDIKGAFKQFGQIGEGYEKIADHLDLSQCIALAYASSSLPDYVNTRSDRGSMRESVEIRMPFQARYLVEMFIAMPSKWRFMGGRWSKYLLRNMVSQYIGDEIAYRSKYGFAQPIWRLPEMNEKLQMREVVGDSPIFEVFPFNSQAKDLLTQRGQERHTWMAYCLAKTYERFQREF